MMKPVNSKEIVARIRDTESPLKRQLLLVGYVTKLLEDQGKEVPTVIGGCALSYYSREVYFTADIDLAYSDREALDKVLKNIGFVKQGRYWVSKDLKMAVEVPASAIEKSPVEVVELGNELWCRIIGIEDLIIDRLNACKYWKSEADCEMVELLIKRYKDELDWTYIEEKAGLPENNILQELKEIKGKQE
jgi:hypothetical protein